MCRPQRSPSIRQADPFVKITLACIHARLDAYCAGIAARFYDISTQALEDLAHLVVRFPLGEPAITKARSTPQQRIYSPTYPYRN